MMQADHRTRLVVRRLLPLGAVLGLFLLPTLFGSTGTTLEPSKDNQYIGSKKCKNCHDTEGSGAQYHAWADAGHSHAFEVLSSDHAKEIAKEKGIKDASKSDDCVKCHRTGFGLDKKLFKKSFDPEGGVGCETCHGPGNDHARARFRAANEADDDDEGFGDEEEEVSYTEIPEGEIGMEITRELCVECHNNESPTYKPFCFYERSAKVRHINPMKPRTAEELAAILECSCGDECECDHDCIEGCGVPPDKK